MQAGSELSGGLGRVSRSANFGLNLFSGIGYFVLDWDLIVDATR